MAPTDDYFGFLLICERQADYDLHEIIAPIRANTVAETDNAEHEANAVATGVVASVLDPNQAILRIESFSTRTSTTPKSNKASSIASPQCSTSSLRSIEGYFGSE
jgi:hypothetical protein